VLSTMLLMLTTTTTARPARQRRPSAGPQLAKSREYPPQLALCWLQAENIPLIWPSIGYKQRMFPSSGSLLATSKEYSPHLALYRLQVENIPLIWLSIGYKQRIFPSAGSLLATSRDALQRDRGHVRAVQQTRRCHLLWPLPAPFSQSVNVQ
jgi:hypothetical protein